MDRLRVVIDTSSLISYVLTKGSIMRQIIRAWERGDFDLLMSPALETELLSVLERPKIRSRVGEAPRLLGTIHKFALVVPKHPLFLGACRDVKDDKFLGCAVAGQAHYLVSSDNDLLILKRYQDVCILNPGQFLIALQLAQLSIDQIQKQYSVSTLQTIQTTLCLEKSTLSKLKTALS